MTGIRSRWVWPWCDLQILKEFYSCELFDSKITGSIDVCFSNPGGSDAGVVVAWDVALNLTHAFDGLEDLDLLGECSPLILHTNRHAND